MSTANPRHLNTNAKYRRLCAAAIKAAKQTCAETQVSCDLNCPHFIHCRQIVATGQLLPCQPQAQVSLSTREAGDLAYLWQATR